MHIAEKPSVFKCVYKGLWYTLPTLESLLPLSDLGETDEPLCALVSPSVKQKQEQYLSSRFILKMK